jgi:hypothetical protein
LRLLHSVESLRFTQRAATLNLRSASSPNWQASLAQAPLGDALKAAYAREILPFLRHCRASRAAATVELARQ